MTKKTGVWRIEAAIDKHCWGQRCYLFSNPEAYGDVRYHMMAATFWTGNAPPRGFSGQPGFIYTPMFGWPTQRKVTP